MNCPADLVQRISKSDIYKDYERAFSDATQLPVALRPTEIWRFALEGKRYQNPFCALLAKTSRTCAACLQVQKEIQDMPGSGAKTATCFAGLCDTAVPVKAGEKVIGYLQTGQVALRKPNEVQFNRITQQLLDWGVSVDLTQLKDAYYHSRTLAPQQYTAMVKLLEIFATHIATLANQIVLQEDEAESPMIRRARAYILANQADPIDLDKVAQAMHVSTFYFCKMFKKATGLTFTDYLSRVRVEKAKTLLLNPHLRISEIAYDVGFQSLTHFNRMFRKIVGESPTAYRESKSVRQLLN
ncbi:MAG: helix-turn-helix domain-containing protein [Verrucomicrobia bacterium]|nr:helix-turn-helix domain-containing protein [Verrucomicrobiota bacterium]MBV8482376.1 helix-turn-helix domain-containing protein [Verrucomicrobiota bacterium]